MQKIIEFVNSYYGIDCDCLSNDNIKKLADLALRYMAVENPIIAQIKREKLNLEI